jgi:O-antigen/teichoic acid export membrane protein
MKSFPGSSSKEKGILTRNTLINVAGKVIPLLVAIITVPFIIKGLGTERFGVLTLVWAVIGYFGLFDMGLGKASTKFVADQEAKDPRQLSPVIGTSILLLISVGIIGGILIAVITPWLVKDILNIPKDLIGETLKAFYILSGAIPMVLGAVGARGILAAQQRFGLVNAVKIPATVINFAGPLFVLIFTDKLQYIVLLLLAERILSFVIYFYFIFRNSMWTGLSFQLFSRWTKRLLGFGVWLAISNFVSPIMVYMDRFIIGVIITMSAVAYYTTPYEIVSRLTIFAAGMAGVLFPAFSVFFKEDQQRLIGLYRKSIRYLLFILIPIVTFLIFAAHPLLYYWLGNAFADHSTTVLRILVIGMLVNSIARIPSNFIQAAGRPDLRAKLHLIELPFYLVLLWFLTDKLGIAGVALAWLIRVSIDCGMMFYLSNRIIPFFNMKRNLILFKASLIAVGVYCITFLFREQTGNLLLLSCAFACSAVTLYLTWHYILSRADRNQVKHILTKVSSMPDIL